MKNDTKKKRITLMDSRMIMKIHSQTWPFLSKLNMLFCNNDSFWDETIHCEHGLKTRLRRGFRCLDTIDKHCDSCWIHNLILWTFHTLALLKFTIEDYDTQSWKLMERIVLYTFFSDYALLTKHDVKMAAGYWPVSSHLGLKRRKGQ